ncbi:MAG TPA: intradiol ring-cleavage dioxygenase [Blastocatellia bacterium]|nr:intradiol ring-cleavage dioxygenase [Blastocatellia bacterium]
MENDNRRQFLKRAAMFAAALPLSGFCEGRTLQTALVGGPCDGCEGIYQDMPPHLTWQTAITDEPGEPLEISGIIYRPDRQTPAPGVILYVYHTDARGYYSPAPNATGIARRHGHLRGWVRTNSRGEYKFRTIRPAPYPNRGIPAHIHPIVKEPDKNEYYIDEYRFADDPLLTPKERARAENRGGSGIIRLSRGSGGVWLGRRDIILGMNVPNYR